MSSGGYMAVQLHVAHSATVSGVGVVAGGPYYCARGSAWAAWHNCRTPGFWTRLPDPRALKAEADALAKAGRIDRVGHLAASRVWLFSGAKDRTVEFEVVEALGRFYALYGVVPKLVDHVPAGHAMVTEAAGNKDCGITRDPYINDCDFDAAGELLRHLLGSLNAPPSKPAGRLMRFDQEAYASGARMDETGYVYVPKDCEAGGCRVHVAFHGCRQNAAAVGERFVREAGYNRWADANRLIVLYPQSAASWLFHAFNPRACWDWWGYTGPSYHTREGAQIRAVMAMIAKLASASE